MRLLSCRNDGVVCAAFFDRKNNDLDGRHASNPCVAKDHGIKIGPEEELGDTNAPTLRMFTTIPTVLPKLAGSIILWNLIAQEQPMRMPLSSGKQDVCVIMWVRQQCKYYANDMRDYSWSP